MTLHNENIGDEAVFLRANQLQRGLLQFTDSCCPPMAVRGRKRKKPLTKIIGVLRSKTPHVYSVEFAVGKLQAKKPMAFWQDTGALLYTKQLAMVRNIYAELYQTADYRDRLDIEKYAIQSESMRRREASVRAAQYIPCLNATIDDLDRNPWLLNVENGTVDLATGELVPHRKEDMITKCAKVAYDKDADCPMWKGFVREIMDYKPELIAFLQTAAGWAVSGDTSD